MKTADLAQAWDQRGDVLQLEEQVRRLEVSEAKRLRALESENAKLKKLLAEAHLDNAALKDLLTKNGDARCQARGRRSSGSARDERAAGVPGDRLPAHDGALSVHRRDDRSYASGWWRWLASAVGSVIAVC